MKYKISVNLNRIPDSYNIRDDFEKARLYHLKHGVELEFVFKNVNLWGYSNYHQSAPLDRWLIAGSQNLVQIDPTANADMFVFDENEWANPPGSQFPLRADTPGGSCFVPVNKPFINIATYSVEHLNGITWVQIAHEIMHSLRYSAVLKGFTAIVDVMDTYRENANPDSPTGNFYEQWNLLQPYLKASPALIPKIVLSRFSDDGKQTLGNFVVGAFKCKTLELSWKNNIRNISCIPKGIYTCRWTYSARFQKFTYQILDVPGRDGIRIHSGNYYFDVDGCIILGDHYGDLNHDQWADIINSAVTVKAFEDLMNKKDFLLQIV